MRNKNSSREKRNLTREQGRKGGRNGEKNRDYFPALSAANPPFTPHKKHLTPLRAQPRTSGSSHALRVYTNSHNTAARTHTHELTPSTPLVRNLPFAGGGGSRLFHPHFSLLLLSSILHGPALLWGPHRGFCADRWPVASLEVGLYRVHPYLVAHSEFINNTISTGEKILYLGERSCHVKIIVCL